MNRLKILFAVLMLAAGIAYSQVTVVPGTPEQINQALSEAPGEWAHEAIEMTVGRGLFIGRPDGEFHWRDDVTRAEVAMVIARLIRSFNLEEFDPEELEVLRQAVIELENDLAVFESAVADHEGRLGDLATELDRQIGEIADLWSALSALQVAPEMIDGAQLTSALEALEERVSALESEIAGLGQGGDGADTSAFDERVAALENQLGEESAIRRELSNAAGDLFVRISDLEGLNASQARMIEDVRSRLGGFDDRLMQLETRVTSLAERLGGIESTLVDHEERIERVEDTVLPDRAPFYVSLTMFGSSPDAGLVGQAAVGYDSLVGNIGARASFDMGFGQVPMSFAGAFTYRATFAEADGYAGVGAGASFEQAGTAMFGELLVGLNYRLIHNLGLYVEGRYRPYFDGSGDGLSAVGGGVQFRF